MEGNKEVLHVWQVWKVWYEKITSGVTHDWECALGPNGA